ncbi:MAG: hypothetical protein ACRDLY_15915 [Thermoleophilaceae bacterium]
MGLFGFVGKLVGGIVKAGASAVTGGVSDKLLSVLSGGGGPARTTVSPRPRAPNLPGWGQLQGIIAAKNHSARILTPSFRPLVRVGGIVTSPGGYASATPVMPGGAPILGLADPVRVGGLAGQGGAGGAKKKRRRAAAGTRKKRRRAVSSKKGGKVRYKGGWYSRKQVANMKRFARGRGRR